MTPPARPPLAAPVAGFPAVVCAALLRERLPTLAVHPDYVAQCRAVLAALDEAAGQWRTWRQACAEAEASAAVDGSAAVTATATGAGLAEIDTATAAVRLRVSPNRVRQLLRAGALGGRRVGRTWLVSAATVEQREGVR